MTQNHAENAPYGPVQPETEQTAEIIDFPNNIALAKAMENVMVIYNALHRGAPHFPRKPGQWETDFTIFKDGNLPEYILEARKQPPLHAKASATGQELAC